jgi:hypothetical protein
MQEFTCPACGFPDLHDEPRTEASGGSFEICPSCGIQFGYSDENGGDSGRPSAGTVRRSTASSSSANVTLPDHD